MANDYLDPFIETLGRDALEQIQLKKLQLMLAPVLEHNRFYRHKLREAGLRSTRDLGTLADLQALPFTTKAELAADQTAHPPYGSNLSYRRDAYTRVHQTSGTTGQPLRFVDTAESWSWWLRCWAAVYAAVGVTAGDRIFFAFGFGPFIGFWSAYEAAQSIGAMALTGGGMSAYQRLRSMQANDATVLVCTPSYALHLAEVAAQEGVDIAGSNVRVTIHAGEPGAGLPATKQRLEQAWGARAFDHAGATEVGAWGFECAEQAGMHANEGEFICEVIDPETAAPSAEGELVITNLGRPGMPVIRYRTGDRVRLDASACPCGRTFLRFDGGVIGRLDDVLIIGGVNVYPSAIENVVRGVHEVGEFLVDVYRRNELDELEIRVELEGGEQQTVTPHVARRLRDILDIQAELIAVPRGSLPRFDHKSKRFRDHR